MTAPRAELWNPHDGSVTSLAMKLTAVGADAALEFAPYESKLIVFSRRTLPSTIATQTPNPPAPLDLARDWRVTISGQTQTVAQLRSWTEIAATRFYSGTVTYEKEINVPAAWLQAGRSVQLDFGEGQAVPEQPRKNGMRAWLDAPVRDAAVVYINEQRVGAVWCPPFALDVAKLLKPGANRVRIVVGNTAINHLAGSKLPDYKELNQKYGERFQPQDMENLQPLPSGLLGPVRLITR